MQKRRRLIDRRQLRHQRFLPLLQAVVPRLQFGARVSLHDGVDDLLDLSPDALQFALGPAQAGSARFPSRCMRT